MFRHNIIFTQYRALSKHFICCRYIYVSLRVTICVNNITFCDTSISELMLCNVLYDKLIRPSVTATDICPACHIALFRINVAA